MQRTFYSTTSVKWILRFSLLMMMINVILIFAILDIYTGLHEVSVMITEFLNAQPGA